MLKLKITNDIKKFVKQALNEDIGKRDITTETLFEENFLVLSHLIAKEKCIIAGGEIFKEVFLTLDKTIKFLDFIPDGTKVKANQIICRIKGPLKPILSGERVALNIISHLSGIATFTNEFVVASNGRFKILDTRKTTPLLRKLEKYAVRAGGGYNHRMKLDEMILIKDNHINLYAMRNGIRRTLAIEQLTKKAKRSKNVKIEVEIETAEEAIIAQKAGAHILMFDNARIEEIEKYINIAGRNRPEIEVSGGITIKDLKKLRNLDIDFVSVGKITHSAPAIDFSLEIESSL